MEQKRKNKTAITVGVIVCATVLISILGTYAFFTGTLGETKNETVKVQTGTLALIFSDNDTLGNIERTLNFGDIVEKELKIENTGTLDAYAKISWDKLTNTFQEGSLTYTLKYKTSETGEWQSIKIKNSNVPRSTEESKLELVNGLLIPANTAYYYKITITYNDLGIDQTSDLNATFKTKFTLDEGTEIKYSYAVKELSILANDENFSEFSQAATTDETTDGLFSLDDDYGTSYYYRGAVENNYVKFGKNANGQDMYWRIIRFNGDGSARLIYDGTQGYTNGTEDAKRYGLIDQAWNANSVDAKYTGWMFGGADGKSSTSKEEAQRNETDSDIKEKVDKWYVTNIKNTGYSKYLVDILFCNDRSIMNGTGYGSKTTQYNMYGRLTKTLKPTFKCENVNDRFTLKDGSSSEVSRAKSDVEGNKDLTYPVGLITTDEAFAAGLNFYDENKNHYLYKSSTLESWTMTPFNNYNLFIISSDGSFRGGSMSIGKGRMGAAPVINLAAEYVKTLLGKGTISEPYVLPTN